MLKINKLNEDTIVLSQLANQDVVARMKVLQQQPDSQRMELLGILLEDQESHNFNHFDDVIISEYLDTRHVLFPFNECTSTVCHLSRFNNPAARIIIEREFKKQVSLFSEEEVNIAVHGTGGFYTELYILLGLKDKGIKTLNLHLTGDKFNELVDFGKTYDELDINTIEFDELDKTNYFRVKFMMFSRIIQWMRAIEIETNLYIHNSCQLDIGSVMDIVIGIDYVDQFPINQMLNFRDLVVSSIKENGLVLSCFSGVYNRNIKFHICKFDDYIEDQQIENLEKLVENIETELKSQKRCFVNLDENSRNKLFDRTVVLTEIKNEFDEEDQNRKLTSDELRKYIINENVDTSKLGISTYWHLGEYTNMLIYEGSPELVKIREKNIHKLNSLRIEDFYDHMLIPIDSMGYMRFNFNSFKIMSETRTYFDLFKICGNELLRYVENMVLLIPDLLYTLYGNFRWNPKRCFHQDPSAGTGTFAHMFGVKGPTNEFRRFGDLTDIALISKHKKDDDFEPIISDVSEDEDLVILK